MRILYSTVSPENYMRPPILSEDQVVCGPDWADCSDPDGRVTSLKTPQGEYDLFAISQKLPSEQQPDVVVCLVDASWRNVPRNLAAFKCPTVLLLADTHHMQNPIGGIIRYLALEHYDRVINLYDRHHTGILRSAGVQNLFWFPGLTFPHSDEFVRASRSTRKVQQIAFVGQIGRFHPRRKRLADALLEEHLPLKCQTLPQSLSLSFYGSSLLGFNSSLNADLNLRVFEILSSGAALLTDKLSDVSGMSHLLSDGKQFLSYSSAEELVEKAEYALTHPEETAAIGFAGQNWFDAFFNSEKRRAIFQRIVFEGKTIPAFELDMPAPSRFLFSGNKEILNPAISVYEQIQDLHATQEEVHVLCEQGVPSDVKTLFQTLPRVHVTDDFQQKTNYDLVVFSGSGNLLRPGRYLWCWDAQPEDIQRFHQLLAKSGYRLLNDDCCFFVSQKKEVGFVNARKALAENRIVEALKLTQEMISQGDCSIETALLMVEIAEKTSNHNLLRNALALAFKIAPQDHRIQSLIGCLEDKTAGVIFDERE